MAKDAKEFLEERGIDTTLIVQSEKYKGATYDLCYLLDKYKDDFIKKYNLHKKI